MRGCSHFINEAKKLGAEAQFDEKYGDIVRVIQMGGFSLEFCGGTHVGDTGKIMSFKILSETSVASGIRRIEAITGRNVLAYLYEKELKINNITDILKSSSNNVEQRAEQIVQELRQVKKDIEKLKSETAGNKVGEIIGSAIDYKGLKIIIKEYDNLAVEELRDIAQKIIDKHEDAIVLFGSQLQDKINYIAMCGTKAVSQKAHAGNIVKSVAKITGGGGGGRPNFAQAGGKDLSKFIESIAQAENIIKEMLD